MRSAGFVLILGVKPCPRATPLGPGVHLASQHLTSFAPQPLHKPHIFRNEGVTGSNPVSSTHPADNQLTKSPMDEDDRS